MAVKTEVVLPCKVDVGDRIWVGVESTNFKFSAIVEEYVEDLGDGTYKYRVRVSEENALKLWYQYSEGFIEYEDLEYKDFEE